MHLINKICFYLSVFTLLFSCTKTKERTGSTAEFIYFNNREQKHITFEKKENNLDKGLVELQYITKENGLSFSVITDSSRQEIAYLWDNLHIVNTNYKIFNYKDNKYKVSFVFGNCGSTDCDIRIAYCKECGILYNETTGRRGNVLLYDNNESLCKSLLSLALHYQLTYLDVEYLTQPPIINTNPCVE